jgi:hypothetical protein
MPTAEEHLKADVGAQLAHLIFQVALLKAEVDRLREDAQRPAPVPAPDGART